MVDGRPSVFKPVPLPSMKHFSVDCHKPAPQSLSLLAHLIVKPSTCIDFSGFPESTALHAIIQVDSLIREKSPSALIDTMSLTSSSIYPGLELNTFPRQTRLSRLLRVRLSPEEADQEHPASWAASLRQLPLSNLRSFSTDVAIPHESWLAVFGDLKSVTLITVSRDAGPTFVQALVEFCPLDDEESSTSDLADRLTGHQDDGREIY